MGMPVVGGVIELSTLLSVIQAEYRQSPTLNLTKLQMQRLWSVDASVCDALVDALVSARVLQRTAHDTYVLQDSRSSLRRDAPNAPPPYAGAGPAAKQ